MHDKQIHLLTKRRFLPLFITQFCEGFNDNTYRFLLLSFISFQLNVSEIKAQELQAIASSVFALPYFIFSATAGQLADKYNKAYVIRVIKTLEIPVMMIAVYGVMTKNISIMLTGMFLIACHATFFGPLKLSILPNHLSKKELLAGNGLIEAGTFVAILLGALFGSAILASDESFHLSAILLIAVAIFSCTTSYLIPHTPRAAPDLKIDINIFKSTKNIIQHGYQDRTVFLAMLGISWLWLSGTVLVTEIPGYVKYVLHGDETVLALLFGMFTLGVAMGSLLVNYLLHGVISTKFVPLTLLIVSIFMLDFSIVDINVPIKEGKLHNISTFLDSSSHWHVLLDTFIIAASYGIFLVPLYTLLQTQSDRRKVARTIAANRIFNAFFMFLGSASLALLSLMQFSITQVLTLLALLNFFASLFFCQLLPKGLTTVILECFFNTFMPTKLKGIKQLQSIKSGSVLLTCESTGLIYWLYLRHYLKRHLHIIRTRPVSLYYGLFKRHMTFVSIDEKSFDHQKFKQHLEQKSLQYYLLDKPGDKPVNLMPVVNALDYPSFTLNIKSVKTKNKEAARIFRWIKRREIQINTLNR